MFRRYFMEAESLEPIVLSEETIEQTINNEIIKTIEKFISQIMSLRRSYPLVMLSLHSVRKLVTKQWDDYISEKEIQTRQDEGHTIYSLTTDTAHEFNRLLNEVKSTRTSNSLLPRSFIVTLVSQYDAYLGQIIRFMFKAKPELLNASEKNLTYSQVIDFGSFEKVREFIIEKEVETVLRKSHIEHFEWLETKLSIPLRKDLKIWPTFVELTERRNLFVHNDGIASSKYYDVCREHSVPPNESKEGRTLPANLKYFTSSYQCILEIGIKMAHVIWRKLKPELRSEADWDLIGIIFDFLAIEEYDLAIVLSEFATDLKQFSSDEVKLTFIINKAQAYKWSGDDKKCKEVLSEVDWSTRNEKLKLCNAALIDDFDIAALYMKRIGDNSEFIGKADYRNWPLFKEFKKTNQFLEAFEEIYNEKFVTIEEIDGQLKDVQIQTASTNEKPEIDTDTRTN
jgi:hypothetical protein